MEQDYQLFQTFGESNLREVDPTQSLQYQAFKLKKRMTIRNKGNQSINALEKAQGIENLFPDQNLDNSLLKQLSGRNLGDQACQILIVVAMYNQKSQHFINTMKGISSNLKIFQQWGVPPEKIGVCVIVDGITPFYNTLQNPKNKDAKSYFSQFYSEEKIIEKFKLREKAQNQQDENRKQQILDVRNLKLENQEEHDEIAHVFMQSVDFLNQGLALQTFFCIKQKNLRKLNTHLWFLGGFCQQINPKFVYFLDVGTKPLENSLFYLYQALYMDDQLAGCCGQIKPMNASIWNFVTISQQVEYKFAHIFDKALQSVLGYITVLPGAFSAYRWEALQGDPLWKDYFRSICHPEEMGPFQANIYLAEDRVLCLSLLTKENQKYLLRYVRKSVAQTDVPKKISKWMAQRRRWINGSWFALIDSLKNINKVRNSSHSLCRKIIFIIQFIYYYINVIFTWFLVSTFFISFSIAIRSMFDYQDSDLRDIGNYLVNIYNALLIMVFIFSMGVHPLRVNIIYRGISQMFGLYMMCILYLMLLILIDTQQVSQQSQLAVGATFALFVLVIVSNCCVAVILKGVFQYLWMTPTIVNVFFIFAVCNIHDCSWGNRPDQMTKEEKDRLEEFREFRTKWTLVWVYCNLFFAYIIDSFDREDNQNHLFLGVLSVFAGVILVLRALFGLVYILIEKCKPGIEKRKKKFGKNCQNDWNDEKTALYRQNSDVCNSFDIQYPGRSEQSKSPNNFNNSPYFKLFRQLIQKEKKLQESLASLISQPDFSLSKVFKYFDSQSMGSIGAEELEQALEELCVQFTEEELQCLIDHFDENLDRRLDQQDLKSLLTPYSQQIRDLLQQNPYIDQEENFTRQTKICLRKVMKNHISRVRFYKDVKIQNSGIQNQEAQNVFEQLNRQNGEFENYQHFKLWLEKQGFWLENDIFEYHDNSQRLDSDASDSSQEADLIKKIIK